MTQATSKLALPVDQRIDVYPTHEIAGFSLRVGRPLPFGATLVPGGVNFSVFSSAATACTLVLFKKGESQPMGEISFPPEFRIGSVWCMTVFDLDYERLEYGYRMDGPHDPQNGLKFDKTKILCDPYAKVVGGRDVWMATPDWNDVYQHRARVLLEDFDWESDRPLELPIEDLVIYEAHVRSFTKHASSKVKHPGTYAAIREKLPYLCELGINCLELMPIFEFDEWENSRKHAGTGETLVNYWGYSTLGFFAPKAGYAATGKLGMQADELKNLVKELHKAGIEVMLDVVFNHTAEGDHRGPTISFRGVDDRTYYMLTPEGWYFNFSGCGNTLNCNHPVVRNMVLDCLRYWASEYHIDGFRFDLAAILGRDQNGAPLANPPLLETLAHDPILAKCKLVAEAWDAGGLYQVGSFPAYGRWAEWNGKYRDALRRFLKGDEGIAGEMMTRVIGSPDLYPHRGPTASINFITCHDGFTLYDSFAYDGKHNEANGENNNDGANDNNSWNCGCEGETEDAGVNALRRRQVKNAFTALMTSLGIPLILSGDEFGRGQHGNNNTYCHDNELNWIDWGLAKKNADLLRFARIAIGFRRAHRVLRRRHHFTHADSAGTGYPDVSFHGTTAWHPDSGVGGRTFAWMVTGRTREGDRPDFIWVAMNSHWDALCFEPPALPQGMHWHVAVNTGMESPLDAFEAGEEPALGDGSHVWIAGRASMILVAR